MINIVYFIAQKTKFYEYLFVLGDFNLPNVDWSNSYNADDILHDFFVMLYTLNLNQIITENTRGNSILDLCFIDASINNDSTSIFFLEPIGCSDHCSLIIKISLVVNYNGIGHSMGVKKFNMDSSNIFNSDNNSLACNYKFIRTDWNLVNRIINNDLVWVCSEATNDHKAWVNTVNIDDLNQYISDIIMHAISISSPMCINNNKSSNGNNKQGWFNHQCQLAVLEKRWFFHQHRRLCSSVSLFMFKSASAKCKHIL